MDIHSINTVSQAQKAKPASAEHSVEHSAAFSQTLHHATELAATQIFAAEEGQKTRFKQKKLEIHSLSELTEEEESDSVYTTVQKLKEKIKDLVRMERQYLGL